MTTKKSTPNSGPSGSGSSARPKKPYATLDLKATEVKSAADDAKKAGSASPAASSQKASAGSTDTAGAKKPAAKGAGAAAGDKDREAKTAAGPSGTDKAMGATGKTSSASASDKKSAERSKGTSAAAGGGGSKTADNVKERPAPKPRSGSGFGAVVSHTFAGLVGGALALLAGNSLTPHLEQLGIPLPGAATDVLEQRTQDLEGRLAALEQSDSGRRAVDTGALDDRVSANEAKLAQLDTLTASLAALETRYQELSASLQASGNSGADAQAVAALGEKIGKLEDELATIRAAAGTGSGETSGPAVANVAAITGRLFDLETSLNNQMNALRTGVTQDIDSRLSEVAEVSEAARSGLQRIDRHVATLRTSEAKLSQQIEVLKADSERTSERLSVAGEETAAVKSSVDALEGRMQRVIAGLATQSDVTTAITAVSSEIEGLRANVGQVVAAEQHRKANAQRIVLSLELGNLKRALERGGPYARELSEVRKSAGGALDLSKLETHEATGVPTLAALKTSFRPVANSVLDAASAPDDGTFFGQFMAGARSVVRVRKVDHNPDDNSAEAVVGRMEKALDAGDLEQVILLSKGLSQEALAPAQDWLSKVEARHSIGVAVREIEKQLKASLSGTDTQGPSDSIPAPAAN